MKDKLEVNRVGDVTSSDTDSEVIRADRRIYVPLDTTIIASDNGLAPD